VELKLAEAAWQRGTLAAPDTIIMSAVEAAKFRRRQISPKKKKIKRKSSDRFVHKKSLFALCTKELLL